MIPFLLFGLSSAGAIPPVVVDTGAGAGHQVGVYYQHKRKTRYETLKKNAIDELLDKSLQEVYRELTDDDKQADTRKQAASIVKPYLETKTRKKIPPVSSIDFRAIENDEESASKLLVLWYEKIGRLRDEQLAKQKQQQYEEEIMIIAAMVM